MTPELRHLQVSLGAQISYRKAAALLRMFLPPMGGTTHTTTRSPVNAVGERIDEQIQREIAENRKPDKPAEQMIIGIDGAFVKGRRPTDRANLEIITGRSRLSTSWWTGGWRRNSICAGPKAVRKCCSTRAVR